MACNSSDSASESRQLKASSLEDYNSVMLVSNKRLITKDSSFCENNWYVKKYKH